MEFKSKQELNRHYIQVRSRLWGGIAKPRMAQPTTATILNFRRPTPSAELVGPWSITRKTSKTVIAEVCKKHDVDVGLFMSSKRGRKVSYARFEAYYRMKEELGYSFPYIAKCCARKDHTSILHGYRVYIRNLEACA